MRNVEEILEFNKIKEKLAELAYTEAAKQKICELQPYLSETEVLARQRETSEARVLLEKAGTPPLGAMDGIAELFELADKGGCLTPEQLEQVALTLTAVSRLKSYLEHCKIYEMSLPYYAENLDPLEEIRKELQQKIRGGRVDDYATKRLKSLREGILRAEEKMREKADNILRTNKECMSDQFSTLRNGHICVPVKKEYKFRISGITYDKSSTGNTIFVEPAAAARYYEELQNLRVEEENEERRILYELSVMLSEEQEGMQQNLRTMEKLDYIFARGKLSMEYGGIQPTIHTDRRIRLVQGRHPLMDPAVNVPLDFAIGDGINGIIITGPNTGGKTVACKTVALNCMMAQCGLHVAAKQAEICMNDVYLCDIGDGQNLSENLSTFSAHITNILGILEKADRDSLVVLDELGSGTDPTEGMGIAVAVLEELKKCGALYLVTTHYPEIKKYAEETPGVCNARMTFDKESLKPRYQMVIGEAGESCAFYIAKKLGMSEEILSRASIAAYGVPTACNKQNDPNSQKGPEESNGYLNKREFQIRKNAPIQRRKEMNKNYLEKPGAQYHLGDSVMVLPDHKIGIICETVNEKGVLRVQLQGKKIYISHKRIRLHVPADRLYPPDYDFSIIFDTVEERKKHHQMERKYVEDTIEQTVTGK